MIHTDLIEHNTFGEMKAQLLRGFLHVSKLKAGDILSAVKDMNYQISSTLEFRQLLRISFHSIDIDLRDTSCEKKNPLYLSVSFVCF